MNQQINIKIYKIDDLSRLKNSTLSDDYLVICMGENYGIWYPFRFMIWEEESYEYFIEKLGIYDPEELRFIIQQLNKAVRESSYTTITLTDIIEINNLTIAYSDNGLAFTNMFCIKPNGFLWHRRFSEADMKLEKELKHRYCSLD